MLSSHLNEQWKYKGSWVSSEQWIWVHLQPSGFLNQNQVVRSDKLLQKIWLNLKAVRACPCCCVVFHAFLKSFRVLSCFCPRLQRTKQTLMWPLSILKARCSKKKNGRNLQIACSYGNLKLKISFEVFPRSKWKNSLGFSLKSITNIKWFYLITSCN